MCSVGMIKFERDNSININKTERKLMRSVTIASSKEVQSEVWPNEERNDV